MANDSSLSVKFTNFDEARKMLRDLPESMQSRVMGDTMKVAAKPVQRTVKSRTPKDGTGALKRSIITVIRRYKKTGVTLALVGPDKKYYENGKRIAKGVSRKGKVRPSKYAHLVEYGHKIATGGALRDQFNYERVKKRDKNGRLISYLRATSLKKKATGAASGFVPPKPFMRGSIEASKAEVIANVSQSLEVGMKRELKRSARKLKRIGIT